MAAAEQDHRRLTPEEVLREHAPRIYSLALRLLNNEADAEDVTQDVLLQVFRKLDTFRGDAALSTWLYRVTVNAALSYRRKRAAREEHRVTEELDEVPQEAQEPRHGRRWSVPPEQEVLDQETQQLIERAIGRLPANYRDVYVLADVEGLPNAEIADLLGLGVPAVKSRLHRARLMMRDALAPHFEEMTA
jgi:RNA polymerase sigma-70 factor (ECF subfamily)